MLPDSPAFSAQLQPGDRILALNGTAIKNVKTDFISVIHRTNSEVGLTIGRANTEFEIRILPHYDDEGGYYFIGVQLGSQKRSVGVFESVSYAGGYMMNSINMVFYSLQLLLSGEASANELSGPVGIVQFASHQLTRDVVSFFNVMAMISIALGVINLMPIPVLDGGHLVMLLFEFFFKRPVPKKVEVVLNNVFAMFLIVMMCFVIFNDIRFWSDRTQLMEQAGQAK